MRGDGETDRNISHDGMDNRGELGAQTSISEVNVQINVLLRIQAILPLKI